MIDGAQVVPFSSGHDVDGFSCGDAGLDDWLRKSAAPGAGQGLNRTHLWVAGSGDVLGYFAFAPAVVVTNPYIDESFPAILLAKFAVCDYGQGQRPSWGATLMYEAFSIAVAAADLIGGRFLATDPGSPRAEAFYEKMSFTRVDDDDPRMVVKLSDVRKALAAS